MYPKRSNFLELILFCTLELMFFLDEIMVLVWMQLFTVRDSYMNMQSKSWPNIHRESDSRNKLMGKF